MARGGKSGISFLRRLIVTLVSAILTFATVVILIIAGGLWVFNSAGPASSDRHPVTVELRQGAGLHEIANSLEQAKVFLDQGLDGVMLGRAAYHDPASVLIGADALWGEAAGRDAFQTAEAMRPYIAVHLANGGRLHQITRHMLGLFHGRPGARGWRRVLSEYANRPGAGTEVLDAALAELHANAA